MEPRPNKSKGPWDPVKEVPFAAAAQDPTSDTLDDLFDAPPEERLPDPIRFDDDPPSTPPTAATTTPQVKSSHAQQVAVGGESKEGLAPVRQSRIKAYREMTETRETEADSQQASQQDELDRRIASQERLFLYVDRLLSLISQEPDLQQWANTVVLTRDTKIDGLQRADLEARLRSRMADARILLDTSVEMKLVLDLTYDELIGISVLGDLWRDTSVDEICIDAWNKIAVERNGKLELTRYQFRSPQHALSVARQLSQKVADRGVSNTNSLVTAPLPQARIQFVYGPLSSHGLAITIRKFRPLLGMGKLLAVGALSQEMAEFLRACVRARATTIVSGGTGTGKTTAINALSESIPDGERVITIEDAFELQLSNTHVVSLQAKQKATADDTIVITQADLLIASLRMRPDRIVVGEIREPSAAAVFFDAANTGHDGSMTTIHSDSTASALNNRLAALLMRSHGGFSENVARESVAQAVQLVVQIARHHTGRRVFSEIAVVDPKYRTDTGIQPFPVFKTEISSTGEARYIRVGSVGTDTQLASKLRVAGEDASKWIQA
jgi:pilus assembly protein CpaF